MRVKGFSSLAAVLVALALVFAGCGSSSNSSSAGGGGSAASSTTASGGTSTSSASTETVGLAKTKFVLHVGLAFGAFHRYLYKPFKAGVFGRPASHKLALAKAALATAFIVHELRIAYNDAQSSPLLRKLTSPITALKDKVTAMAAGLRAGRYNPAQINSAQGDVTSITSKAAAAGAPVKDLPVPAF